MRKAGEATFAGTWVLGYTVMNEESEKRERSNQAKSIWTNLPCLWTTHEMTEMIQWEKGGGRQNSKLKWWLDSAKDSQRQNGDGACICAEIKAMIREGNGENEWCGMEVWQSEWDTASGWIYNNRRAFFLSIKQYENKFDEGETRQKKQMKLFCGCKVLGLFVLTKWLKNACLCLLKC